MTHPADDAAQAFQVDLRGVVDLLARHLYSGPRVYVRELLQNAVDAVTARRALDPAAPGTVRLRAVEGGVLEVTDTGVGLTADEARELLATVGRSSKRDLELGVGRAEFLGQFGIGLLSAFMVSDRIELVSRSAADPDAPVVRWVGHSDGTYDLTTADRAAQDEPGSTVRLHPRRDLEHWLAPETVAALAAEFGSLLPLDVQVEVPLDGGGVAWRRVTEPDLPWRATYPDAAARDQALVAYCERALGFTPLACIDLDVPLTGLTGVAFVLPAAVPPGNGRHRVHLKRMLVGQRVDGLLPDWAFYVRCVVDADGLRPTASREALYDDEALLVTRDALAAQVRDWTVRTLRTPSRLSRDLVATHHLAVRSLALVDDEMLDLAAQVLPFETSDGTRTLAEVAAEGAVVHTTSLEEYRRVAPIARAQGLLVVNAGYVYDADLLARLTGRSGWDVRPLRARDVAQVLDELAPERELELLDAVTAASAAVRDLDAEVVVRRFAPQDLPAVLLDDRDDEHRRDVARAVDAADDLWGGVLAGFSTQPAPARRLVLNDANATVRRLLAGGPRPEVFAAGVRSLYVTAVLLAGEPLRTRDATTMTDAMTVLLDAGLRAGDDEEETR
ncbi:HSP90 family protein [Cellulomonas fimi]|uniref:ATP-binding region ATPase domain protein n=1 Tax=Cellulomonas fimi (strain ATCC 484 / DSM 20113 / JCM 1341 / CCUG 24087 / LMG 16345 / NBRC 15513 / NCIMB 8980 / NCTC 7547 / NRS-133) TaxID=590998 RepID=F4H4Q7_CELFA|nr:HSP90 family protein [Cellulomonas fimi]AEE44258.1 ATP-binding region ATPase domain protein [Cellulomonas fimi ATCC 484]NNH05705.1 HSP90 family protein [Cellulomonas fimi]VEH25986.1 High temperature protein G [Cellulomonas fimi]